jgi:hypothetical protein
MNRFKFFRGQSNEPLYWVTAMGEGKLVSTMSGEHIVNVMRTITDGYIPNPYIGRGNIEWMEIFEAELNYRRDRITSL